MLGALLPRRVWLSDVLSDERLEEGSRQRLLLAATLLQLLKAQPIPLLLQELDLTHYASDLIIRTALLA